MLLGRGAECERIERLVARARSGASGVLVISGEPGIGKTALLDHAASVAGVATVLRVRGVESEVEVAFAGLYELLRPVLGDLGRLPAPQAAALEAALALAPAAAAEPHLVGAATLGLLASLAEDRPVLVLADDVHWLDRPSASALAFAARRVEADAHRRGARAAAGRGAALDLGGIEPLTLAGLDGDAARTLLAAPPAGRCARRASTGSTESPAATRWRWSSWPLRRRACARAGRRPRADRRPHRARARPPPRRPRARGRRRAAGGRGRRRGRDRAGAGGRPRDRRFDGGAGGGRGRRPRDARRRKRRVPPPAGALRGARPRRARRAPRRPPRLRGGARPRDPSRAPRPARRGRRAGTRRGGGRPAGRGGRRGRRARGHAAAAAALEQAARLTPDPARRAQRLRRAADAAWLAGDGRVRSGCSTSASRSAGPSAPRSPTCAGACSARRGPVPLAVRTLREGAEAIAAEARGEGGGDARRGRVRRGLLPRGRRRHASSIARRAYELAPSDDARARGLAEIAVGAVAS